MRSFTWHSSFFRRLGTHLCSFAKAIGFGSMRPRNERSAHFCTVPARHDTEPERLFCFDMTRREILQEVCFQESARSSIERRVKLRLLRRTPFVQVSSQSRTKSASTTVTRSR